MGINALSQNLTTKQTSKTHNSGTTTKTVTNKAPIKMVQKNDQVIKEYPVFKPSSDNLSKEDYIKEQNAYDKARVNYYVKEFKSHGILQREKTSGLKLGEYKIIVAKDGYKIDTKAMQKALGEPKELKLGDLKYYLGLPNGYIRKKIGDLSGDMDTYPASKLTFVDSDVINTRYDK